MPKPSKSGRAHEAREQALRLREEQERAARRQRAIAITLVVVGIAVVGGLVFWILSQQPEPRRDFSDVENPLSEVTLPSTAGESGGIPVGESGVAGDVDADADTVEIAVYLDFLCPACQAFEQQAGPFLDQLRAEGDVVVDYRPVAILDHRSGGSEYSTRSATAAGLVADSSPDAFVPFMELLYANQPTEGGAGLSDEEIAELARSAGASDEVAGAIEDGSYLEGEDSFVDWVTAATTEATREHDPFGTPYVMVDGEVLESWDTQLIAQAVEAARG